MPLRTAVKSINVNTIMVFDDCQRSWDKLPRYQLSLVSCKVRTNTVLLSIILSEPSYYFRESLVLQNDQGSRILPMKTARFGRS